jgi:PEP-CTERM motif-containing protein
MTLVSRTLSLGLCGTLLLGLLLASRTAHAATIVIPATTSGWYTESSSSGQSNENYLVGMRGGEYRNFFVFDLTSLLNEAVVSATLRLWNPIADPPDQIYDGYESVDPTETYEVVEVTTPAATLLLGALAAPVYQDLGDGTAYASRVFSAADNGTNVDIALNAAAVAAIDSAVGLYALGGHLTTLGNSPFDLETVFGGTSDTSLRELVIETAPVPEPASGALVAIGVIAMAARRRRS